MENNKTISPEILMGDIKRYLSEGVSLEDIHKGALENGISEELWNKALKLLNQPKKKKKKYFILSVFLIGFLLIFLGILFLNKTNEIDEIDEPKKPNKPNEPQIETEFFAPEKEQKKESEKETNTEKFYKDRDFQKKINQKEILVIKQYDEPQIISNLSDVVSFVTKESPNFLGLKKMFFEFDKTGSIKRNMIIFWDESSQEKIFVQNMNHPYVIKNSLLFSNKAIAEKPSQILIDTSWSSLFEKIEFSKLKKEGLTLDIEIYSEQNKKYVRISIFYPKSENNASIETQFYEYKNVFKETKTAFGKYPKISTGIFSEKYPKKKTPRRSQLSE